jgi:hypothetical protein
MYLVGGLKALKFGVLSRLNEKMGGQLILEETGNYDQTYRACPDLDFGTQSGKQGHA